MVVVGLLGLRSKEFLVLYEIYLSIKIKNKETTT